MSSDVINVADKFAKEDEAGHDQYIFLTSNVSAGIGDLWALIRKMMTTGLFSDAMALLDMWTNDGKYTLAQFRSAIQAALAKLGINIFSNEPVAPKLKMDDGSDDDGTVMRAKRISREDVYRHLAAEGIDKTAIAPGMLFMLVELAIRFGLPFIQAIIEKIKPRQKVNGTVTFGMLTQD